MRSAAILISAVVTAGSAYAATFTSEIQDHSVTVYSTSKIYERCDLSQPFSFMNEGERKSTAIECHVDIDPGNHRQVCEIKHDLVVDPKLEGPVKVDKCEPRLSPAITKKK